MGKLNDKVAIVTGASKGIGASIAKHFGAEGASVVVNYSSSKKDADQVVQEIIKSGGKAIAIQANCAKKSEIDRLFKETLAKFGKVDILVNNAGLYEFKPLEEISEEHFHKQFDLNVLGLLLATQKAVESFGPNGGSIINISSVAALSPVAGAAVYSATKAAVDAITRSLAQELGPKKIRVNSLNPGMIETEGLHTTGIIDSEFKTIIEKQTPLGRIGQPIDVSKVALFLASEDSAWITGETHLVSGGHR